MPHDVPIIIITMCIVGPEKKQRGMNGRRGNAFDVDYPLCSYGHICWLLNLKKMLRCEWGWNSLWQEHALAAWGPSLQAVLLSANTHFVWKQTYLKKWAKSCWNNADDHYNVFFPHPNPSSTSAEKERLTFKRVGENRLNTGDHCTMLFSQPTFLASSEKICT